MNKIQQDNILLTCIEDMKITRKNIGFVSDCPFIKIERSTDNEDLCAVYIIGSEETNESCLVSGFHIGILDLTPTPEPFYSSVIPEYSLLGIYRAIKNNEYAHGVHSSMLPLEFEKEYLELVIPEFGDWLYQKKMITKKERNT